MVIIMKNDSFDSQIKKSLQEQAALFEPSADADRSFQEIMDRLQETKKEEYKMKHFDMKKVLIATAAAVMVLGTITVASGKIAGIVSHSSSIPDYTRYADLAEAEARAGVLTDAPESFSNGYRFKSINLVDTGYKNEDGAVSDNFTSLSLRYAKGSDTVIYDIQPRPFAGKGAADISDMFDIFDEDGTTFYYMEAHNKWVPGDYKPTEEEKAQVEAGTLNIGYGAAEISYSDSKQLFWEKDGHERSLFCMDSELSREELIEMALEID